MMDGKLLGLAALAFLLMSSGKKKSPPRGTVTLLEDEIVDYQVKPKPAAKPPAPSLEDELIEQQQDAAPPAGDPRPPGAIIDVDRPRIVPATDAQKSAAELFAATAAQAAQQAPTTQKEASVYKPPPPPVAPVVAPVVAPPPPPAPKKPPTGPIIDVVYKPPPAVTNVSPVLQPKPQGPQIPAGYDPAKARAGAPAIASHLAKKGPSGYARAELKIWQTHAALTPDGIYGGSTRGALIHYGVKDPPRPYFKPTATIPYVPPEQRT